MNNQIINNTVDIFRNILNISGTAIYSISVIEGIVFSSKIFLCLIKKFSSYYESKQNNDNYNYFKSIKKYFKEGIIIISGIAIGNIIINKSSNS